jgi:hypothetical protein
MSTFTIPFNWERIADIEPKADQTIATYRAKVFGGWLVRVDSLNDKEARPSFTMNTVFIQDEKHEWDL